MLVGFWHDSALPAMLGNVGSRGGWSTLTGLPIWQGTDEKWDLTWREHQKESHGKEYDLSLV